MPDWGTEDDSEDVLPIPKTQSGDRQESQPNAPSGERFLADLTFLSPTSSTVHPSTSPPTLASHLVSQRSSKVPHATSLPHQTQLNQPPPTPLLLNRVPNREQARALPHPVDVLSHRTRPAFPHPPLSRGPKPLIPCTTSRAC